MMLSVVTVVIVCIIILIAKGNKEEDSELIKASEAFNQTSDTGTSLEQILFDESLDQNLSSLVLGYEMINKINLLIEPDYGF